MTSYLDGLVGAFNYFWGIEDSDEDEYEYQLPTSSSNGKRKAKRELRRPSDSRPSRRPRVEDTFVEQEYDDEEEEYPRYLQRGHSAVSGVSTLVEDEVEDEENDVQYPRRGNVRDSRSHPGFRLVNQPRPPRRSYPGERASPTELRAQRTPWLDALSSLRKNIVSAVTGQDEESDVISASDLGYEEEHVDLAGQNTARLPEFQADADLSEGEWGRRYWAPMTDYEPSPRPSPELPESQPEVYEEIFDKLEELPAEPRNYEFLDETSSKDDVNESFGGSVPRRPTGTPAPSAEPHANSNIGLREKWETAPVQSAREIIDRSDTSNRALKRIRAETGEPEYVVRDVEIRDMFWQIMDRMERLATKFFSFEFRNKKTLTKAFKSMDPATALIISCVASGGPGGQEGWRELFYDETRRRALVCAIIGNVLVEQVFKHACFGADLVTLERLKAKQKELKDEDGFLRTEASARLLRPLLLSQGLKTLTPPSCFASHAVTIAAALSTHLSPILSLAPKTHLPTALDALMEDLLPLVTLSGLLNLHMRTDPHTVYYFTPVFKEDRFDPTHYQAFNHTAMHHSHPRSPHTKWPSGTTEAEKKRAQGDEALTQILLMDGVTAYRKGGWEAKGSKVWKPLFARKKWGNKGQRARVLVHGWVFCRWGRARKFKDGVKCDVEGDHGVQWREPGFVEFKDLNGVPSRVGEKRSG